MTTEYIDLELQRWLAEQLQNELRVGPTGIYWKCDWQNVQYTEWLHVVSLVEEKLTVEQLGENKANLIELIGQKEPCHGYIYRASWQQRTTALSQTLNIPIRDQAIGDQ